MLTFSLRIGDAAKNAFHQNPKNTVFDAKRLIGRKMDEDSIKRDLKHMPFTVKGKNNAPIISVKYKDETREFVSLFLFFFYGFSSLTVALADP
jgi:molecular chaperone DnaK (HSP70)